MSNAIRNRLNNSIIHSLRLGGPSFGPKPMSINSRKQANRVSDSSKDNFYLAKERLLAPNWELRLLDNTLLMEILDKIESAGDQSLAPKS